MTDSLTIIEAYISASQRARGSGSDQDFEALRGYLAEEIEIRRASPWTDEPFVIAHTGPDAVITRLREASNAGSQLSTETVNAVLVGGEVLVEQVSTLHTVDGDKVSCVAHIFTLVADRITSIRTYRNDLGLPEL